MNDAGESVLVWTHQRLGRVDVPVDMVAAIVFAPDEPQPEPGRADVVVLRNGDRVEGLITRLGDPLSIEVAMGDESQ